MFRTTLKGLMAHKLRMLLTALAVVLGVGFIAGTYILTDTMNKTFDNLFTDITEGDDVYVRAEKAFDTLSEDRAKIPAELLETVRSVDGVGSAEGSIQGYAQLVDKDGEAITPNGPPTIGVNWFESPGGAIEIRSGSAPQGPGEVAIDAGTADKYDFAVGDEIEVLLLGPAESFEVVGIIGFGEADNLAGATLAAFDTATAERVLDSEGEFDAIEVMAHDGVSDLDLKSRVAEVLPNGVDASTGTSVASEQSQALQEGLGFFTTALLVFGYIALFVGAFIIFTTFSIVVAQRTR
ncbi:MAG: ABC transporter permease, partial [Actinomycetota bacterium]